MELWDAGYRPIALYSWDLAWLPLKDRGKRPKGDEWQARARQNPPGAVSAPVELDAMNNGILCDGLRVPDIDVEDADTVAHLRSLAFHCLGDAPLRYRENSARCLFVYRATEGEPPKRQIVGKFGKVEVLGRGQQFAAYGRHPSGALLRWAPEGLAQTARDTLPAVTEAQITAFFAEAMPLIGAKAEKAAGDGVRAEDPAELRTILQILGDGGAERIATAEDLPAGLHAKLDAAVAASDRLSRRWTGDVSDLHACGRDSSRSGQDFSLAALLKRAGFAPTQAATCLLAFDHGSAHDEAKHPDARARLRYVARSALRASAPAERSEHERELCRAALDLLRAGVEELDVVGHIREVNADSAAPLGDRHVDEILFWAARTAGLAS
jgi:hypothetical protein